MDRANINERCFLRENPRNSFNLEGAGEPTRPKVDRRGGALRRVFDTGDALAREIASVQQRRLHTRTQRDLRLARPRFMPSRGAACGTPISFRREVPPAQRVVLGLVEGPPPRVIPDCHFRMAATEYDREPGIKSSGCTSN